MKVLGFDFSTQSAKGVILDTCTGDIQTLEPVDFGRDLPQYGAPHGFVRPAENPLSCHSDPMMWLDALDLLLTRSKTDFSQIQAISGSGQQHGSVYLDATFAGRLAALDASRSLKEQLAPALTRPTAPIWMDRSTSDECADLEDRFGDMLQKVTGSPATERFTGPQIRHFWKINPDAYERTAVIHLVSSFVCSVLAGKSAPIDYGDGAGMNLLDLTTLDWNQDITAFSAPGLMAKLPEPVPGGTTVGCISAYFVKKYGFSPDCRIMAWSGDNPCSLVGMGLGVPGIIGISLGTSDTVFAGMESFAVDPDGFGHVFGNPVGGFMSLICFTNGSLARESVRTQCGASWDFFDNEACRMTCPGNEGRLMLPYFDPESTPKCLKAAPVYNFSQDEVLPEIRIRAVLEAQALSMRLHSQWINQKITRVVLTGGAAKCAGLQQVLADVFQAPVEIRESAAAAPLGAAMIAAAGTGSVPYEKLWSLVCHAVTVVQPNAETADVYRKALADYRKFEAGYCGRQDR